MSYRYLVGFGSKFKPHILFLSFQAHSELKPKLRQCEDGFPEQQKMLVETYQEFSIFKFKDSAGCGP